MCIHGGTSIDCKRCNNPYKSVYKTDRRLNWSMIKNESFKPESKKTASQSNAIE